jgi:ABC-type ATPase involved in cell division
MSDTEKILVDDESLDSLAGIFPMDTSTSMVLVLGETGAGKSYFVKKLTANTQVKVGHNLDSCKSTYSSGGVPTSPPL